MQPQGAYCAVLTTKPREQLRVFHVCVVHCLPVLKGMAPINALSMMSLRTSNHNCMNVATFGVPVTLICGFASSCCASCMSCGVPCTPVVNGVGPSKLVNLLPSDLGSNSALTRPMGLTTTTPPKKRSSWPTSMIWSTKSLSPTTAFSKGCAEDKSSWQLCHVSQFAVDAMFKAMVCCSLRRRPEGPQGCASTTRCKSG